MEEHTHHNHQHEHQHHKHEGHEHHEMHKASAPAESDFRLAISATLHCLVGCGIGEVAGMIISTAIGLNNLHSIILAVILGFIAGLVLGIMPLRKHGFTFNNALKTVLITEGISITVMEAFEVFAEVSIPGVMNAHLNESIFWLGMFAALIAGFIAALPVNYILVKRGIRHQH